MSYMMICDIPHIPSDGFRFPVSAFVKFPLASVCQQCYNSRMKIFPKLYSVGKLTFHQQWQGVISGTGSSSGT